MVPQADADSGVSLWVALQRFHSWLVSLGLAEHKNPTEGAIAEAKAQFAAFLADPETDFEVSLSPWTCSRFQISGDIVQAKSDHAIHALG